MSEVRFTYEPFFPDGSPRRFAGVWRPTLEKARAILDEMTADEFNSFTTSYPSGYGSFGVYGLQMGRFDRNLYHLEEGEVEW